MNKILIGFTILFLGTGFVSQEEQLIDRVSFYKHMINIYGTSLRTDLKEMVLYNRSVFKGPCSIPGAIYYNKDGSVAVENPELDCERSPAHSKLSVTGKHSKIRQAWVHKVCQRVSFDKTSLRHALNKANLTRASAINKKNILQALKLFQVVSKTELKTMDQALNANIDKLQWSEIFYAICVSESWQRI